MLTFKDSAKWVRIFREITDDQGHRTLDPVANVAKPALDLPPALNIELSPKELSEAERVLGLLRDADDAETRAWALKLPQILRRVTDYYRDHASEDERKIISQAVTHAFQSIRRADRSN